MKYSWLSYRFCYANRPHFYLLPAIAQFQTKRGGVRVRVLGDKQQVALIRKKKVLNELCKSLKFGVDRSNIQQDVTV